MQNELSTILRQFWLEYVLARQLTSKYAPFGAFFYCIHQEIYISQIKGACQMMTARDLRQ